MHTRHCSSGASQTDTAGAERYMHCRSARPLQAKDLIIPIPCKPSSFSVLLMNATCVFKTCQSQLPTWKLLDTGRGPWPKTYAESVLRLDKRSVLSTKRCALCTAAATAACPTCLCDRLACCISAWKDSSSDETAATALASCVQWTQIRNRKSPSVRSVYPK